jgi:hypothetical protein
MTAHFPGMVDTLTHKYMTAHFPGMVDTLTHKYMTAHFPGLVDTPNTQIHDCSLSWNGTGISIQKSKLMQKHFYRDHYQTRMIIFIFIKHTISVK